MPPVRHRRLARTAAAWIFLAAGPLLGASRSAQAVVEPARANEDEQLFPKPAVVRKMVRFWEKIFYKYPSTTVVVHESSEPDRIIDVIDYKAFARQGNKSGPVPRRERDAVTQKYLKRYNKAAARFEKEGERATRYGAIEKRLFNVYRGNPLALKKLYSGDLKLRAQTGLADDFLLAATTAQTYLPYMEKVFNQYGVPTRVTRLAFVESMFNVKARSKVGASGIWQFMPATARNYIFVNGLVDERNSPFKETRAAAQFLLTNFRELGSWPLAITAYNHGKDGMARAMHQLGTRDLGAIIQRFDARSFGFASKNFYSEFLAASNTYDRLYRTNRIGKATELPDSEAVILKRPVSIADILRFTNLTRDVLAALNPCILATTFTVNAEKPLPMFYEIRVPRHLARQVKTALLSLKTTRYARK